MHVLLALINEGGDGHVDTALQGLPASFLKAHDSVVVLRFCRAPQPAGDVAGVGGVQVETIISEKELGYGEQVKLAFEFACRRGLDAVVTVDGKPRYPLEDVAGLLAALAAGADMAVAAPASESVFTVTGAGAWLASRLVNLLMRARITAWHPGFRAYRVAALAEVPFDKNVDDRGFNTEIIIQLLIAKRSIARVPTRGYAHAPLGLADKFRFAWGMLQAAGLSLLHQSSLFYQPQFDMEKALDTYGLKLGYRSSHSLALAAVPPGSRVLDIGCGNGAFDRLLMEQGCSVHGLDRHPERAVTGLDAYTQIDLDVQNHAFPVHGYEYILLLDVLEHMRHPETLLAYLRAESGPQPKPRVLISIPNVAFFIIRLRLLCGSFHYGKLGILDLTHTRLFTEKSILALLTRNGYRVESVAGIPPPYPKAIGSNIVSRLLLAVNQWGIALSRQLFSYQLLVVAQPKPTLDDLLPPPEPSRHV